MTKEDKEQLNIEISHIFESGANHLRIFDMVENFIDKRYKPINFTHCCTEFCFNCSSETKNEIDSKDIVRCDNCGIKR